MLKHKNKNLFVHEKELLKKYYSVSNTGEIINKTVRMNESVAQKLKIATKLNRCTQGEMLEMLIDDFIQSYNENYQLINDIRNSKEKLY